MRWAAIVGVVFVLLLVVAIFTYASYSQTKVQISGVTFAGITPVDLTNTSVLGKLVVAAVPVILSPGSVTDWMGLAAQLIGSVNLQFQITITDHGLTPVYVPAESHQVFFDGVQVATGNSSAAFLSPDTSLALFVPESIASYNLPTIAESLFSSGGLVVITIEGAINELGSSVPFVYHFTLNLLSMIERYVANLLAEYGLKVPSYLA